MLSNEWLLLWYSHCTLHLSTTPPHSQGRCYVFENWGQKVIYPAVLRVLWTPGPPLCPRLSVTRLADIRRGAWGRLGVDRSGEVVTKFEVELVLDWDKLYTSNRVHSPLLFIPRCQQFIYIQHITKHIHWRCYPLLKLSLIGFQQTCCYSLNGTKHTCNTHRGTNE